MGMVSDFQLGRILTKPTTLFVKYGRVTDIKGDEKEEVVRKYNRLSEKLKDYDPEKVALELTNNMLLSLRLEQYERLEAQEELMSSLTSDGLAVQG